MTIILTGLQASGNLHASRTGPKGFEVSAAEGELEMAGANQARSGSLSGGVTFASKSDTPAEGKAGKILLTFGTANRLTKARAQDSFSLSRVRRASHRSFTLPQWISM